VKKWDVSHVQCPSEVTEASVAQSEHPLTSQQQDIVDTWKSGIDILAVEAGAGAGKTSTLIALAKADGRKGQYLAFNRGIVSEARTKFAQQAPNFSASTIHAIAKAAVGGDFEHRIRQHRVFPSELAIEWGINESFTCTFGDESRTLAPKFLASYVLEALRKFCDSDAELPETKHFRYLDTIDKRDEAGKFTYTNNNRLRAQLLPVLRRLWDNVSRPEGRLQLGKGTDFLNVLVKVFAQLDDPAIPGDVLAIDEAQDLSPVMLQIVHKQNKPVILVGDSQQQIYSWRGAVNALQTVKATQTLYLTQSFRFGPEIAAVANAVLAEIPGAAIRVEGAGPKEGASRIGYHESPDAILTRTNAGGIAQALSQQKLGRRTYLEGGSSDIKSLVKAAGDLMMGRRTTNPELAPFGSWDEVRSYVTEDEPTSELKLFVKLVDENGIDIMTQAVSNKDANGRDVTKADADVVITTVHKCKGEEWNSVKLAGDFSDKVFDSSDDEAKRLLYVAVTRARQNLDITDCSPMLKLLGMGEGE
jgi:hypothetical protein